MRADSHIGYNALAELLGATRAESLFAIGRLNVGADLGVLVDKVALKVVFVVVSANLGRRSRGGLGIAEVAAGTLFR